MDKATYDRLVSGELTIEQLRQRHPPRSPWRADALEAQLLEAEAVIVMAQRAVGVDHPAWVVLDDYDGSMDSLKDLVAENTRLREANAASPEDLEDLSASINAKILEVAAEQRAESAQLIRDELVCCDIFERLEGLYTEDGRPTYAYRTLRNSSEYHDICHYGEWAARIVEKGGRNG